MKTNAPENPVSHNSAPRSRSTERSNGGARVTAAYVSAVTTSAHCCASVPARFPHPHAEEDRVGDGPQLSRGRADRSQYAFSDFASANGVITRMVRSNSTDQFSI